MSEADEKIRQADALCEAAEDNLKRARKGDRTALLRAMEQIAKADALYDEAASILRHEESK